MATCLIALGGNVGPVAETFDRALEHLARHPRIRVVGRSANHITPAVGHQAGDRYVNAAAALETDLPAAALLALLHEVEQAQGRLRTIHWGPRPLDLDLLFHGAATIDLPTLTVPHPACWYRRFVLDPLCEIAPDFDHPVKQLTMQALRARLLARPLALHLAGGEPSARAEIARQLSHAWPNVQIGEWSRATDPTILAWLGRGPDVPAFRDLPLVPRLDATRLEGLPAQALHDVLAACHS